MPAPWSEASLVLQNETLPQKNKKSKYKKKSSVSHYFLLEISVKKRSAIQSQGCLCQLSVEGSPLNPNFLMLY